MKKIILYVLPTCLLIACAGESENKITAAIPLSGTWHLISGTTITGTDTVVIDYTDGQQMIKILNDSHFAFIRHDLNKGNDTANAVFSAGGGRYTLKGDQYTEYLDYCNLREWEGHSFNFTVSISNDTLIQKGIEKLEDLGINRLIIEKYIRTTN